VRRSADTAAQACSQARHLLESDRPDRFTQVVALLLKMESFSWNLKPAEVAWLLPLCSAAAARVRVRVSLG
jgi:hypothetical protein